MGTLLYLIREGARGFYHAKFMTFVSIATIAVTIFLVMCVTVGMINIGKLFKNAVEESDVVVYVNDRTSSDTAALAALITGILGLPQVRQASMVDKKTAWERFTAIYGREMLSAVDENPFPVSVEIALKNGFQNSRAAAGLKEQLETLSGVDGVRYAREWMDFLGEFRRYVTIAAVVLGIIIFFTLYIIISNTIKLTIYARRELIRNMRLVGATRFFISMPFIIEGMLQGLIGGVFGVAFFSVLKAAFIYVSSLRTIPLVWGASVLPLLFILLGVFFGWTGSVFATRKFLS
jgi:cell division transport system permease protein